MEKIAMCNNYTVIDLEWDQVSHEILQIGALRIRNGQIAGRYDTFVKPINPCCKGNVSMITDDIVADAPHLEDVIDDFLMFISDDIIVGHNVSTDIDHIKRNADIDLNNDTRDTYLTVKKSNLNVQEYNLDRLSAYFGLGEETHNAIDDCELTYHLFEILKHIPERHDDSDGSLLKISYNPRKNKNNNYKIIEKSYDIFDEVFIDEPDNDFLEDKKIVFTDCEGLFNEKFVAKMQRCGYIDNPKGENVTQRVKTDFLIIGSENTNTLKTKKALQYNQKGADIKIMTFAEFEAFLDELLCAKKNT